MGSIRETAYKIAEFLGRNTDQGFINAVISSVTAARSQSLRRRMKQEGTNPIYQRTIKENLVDSNTGLPCDSIVLDECVIKRTANPIPNSITINGMQPYRVGASDRTESFTFIQPEQIKFVIEDKYDNSLKWAYVNKYIYVFNQMIEEITITFIPENPLDLEDYECSDCAGDFDFIPDDLVKEVTYLVLNELRVLQNNTDNGEIDKN